MSIKPTSPDLSRPPAPARSQDKGGRTEGAFAERLAASLEQSSPETLARVLALGMMRSLLDDGEDGGLSSLSLGLPPAPPLLPPAVLAPPAVTPSPPPDRVAGAYRRQEAPDIEALAGKAAERFEIAPGLVKAVIRAESDFNPRAVSPAGAQGLMQLMPGTARDLGVADPFDPEENIAGGTRYLKRLLDRYDGDLDAALAAYNWGPGNLDRRGAAAMPEETRNYLVRVKRYLDDYSA